MQPINVAKLPTEVMQYIVELRKEAGKHRHERNAARRELAALKAEIGR